MPDQEWLEFFWRKFVREANLFVVLSAISWLGGIVAQRKANTNKARERATTSNIPLTYLLGVRPKVEKVYVAPAILQVLALVHLVLGGLALWFDNETMYYVITLVCWGPLVALMLYLAAKGKMKPKADDTKEPDAITNQETKGSDSVDVVRELIALTEEESMTKQGADEADQEESLSDRRGRRERRRRN